MLRPKTDRHLAAMFRALTEQMVELEPNCMEASISRRHALDCLMLANKHRMRYEIMEKRGQRWDAAEALRTFRYYLKLADDLVVATFILQNKEVG